MMRLRGLHLLYLTVCLGLNSSCWLLDTSPKSDGSKANPPSDAAVAIVNDVEISRAAFDAAYAQAVARYTQTSQPIKPALAERLKDSIVEWLVDQQIVQQQANRLGIEVSDDELEQHWQDHKKRYGPPAAFKIFLNQAQSTEADIKASFGSNLLREKLFRHISAKVTIDDSEIERYYEANRASYNQDETVHAAHILIRLPNDVSPKERKRRYRLARKIAIRAKKNPKDFDKLAKEYSEDETTKNRGGDFGPFKRGQMIVEFERAAFEMKTNAISGVVESAYGYHIIKKIAHNRARSKTLKDVRKQIAKTITTKKRNQAVRDTFRRWKHESNIKILLQGDKTVINSVYDNNDRGQIEPAGILDGQKT